MSSLAALPGSSIGILGSGQLGRMLAMAAQSMGYRVVVLGPDPDDPALQVADAMELGAIDDVAASRRLAEAVDVVTLEFENVSLQVAQAVDALKPLRPHPRALAIAQHRLDEKRTLTAMGAPTARFFPVESFQDLELALNEMRTLCVLKRVHGGYDGKGQAVIADASAARGAFESLGGDGELLIAESFVPFVKELSVIVARNVQGQTAAFPVAENEHRQGILHMTIAPARIDAEIAREAQELAESIARDLDIVGLLAVEMFLLESGRILVNEIAPRPHNSGHYTLDACLTSQFEQHVRAVCGLPLGSTDAHSHAVMVNVLGERHHEAMTNLPSMLNDPFIKAHSYRKKEARPGRKMGHVTALGNSVDEAMARAQQAWHWIANTSTS